MSEPRLPLTPAERADLREMAEIVHANIKADQSGWYECVSLECDGYPHDDARYIAAISPDRLLALLDEVERLHDRVRWLEALRDMNLSADPILTPADRPREEE